MAPLETALRKVVFFLEEADLRYAIIGGIALAHWGAARYTHDIDVKVHIPNLDYTAVRNAIRRAFSEQARMEIPENPFIVAVNVDGVVVDFLLALPGYEEQIIARAVQRDFGGWTAWICSAEDLIIQKVVAGRSKDWPDVEALLIEQRGKLDEAYIQNWLAQFAEALEEPDLLSNYQKLLAEIKDL